MCISQCSEEFSAKIFVNVYESIVCELCGQIFVLMEFGQSLPFLLRDGERDEKIPFPNNSMGRIAKKLCFLVCLFLLFFSCPEQLNLKRQRTTYYWHYKLLICWPVVKLSPSRSPWCPKFAVFCVFQCELRPKWDNFWYFSQNI